MSHVYAEGEECNLTGRPRRTEARFTCGADLSLAVKEEASCEYLVTLSTPLLCTHPAFQPKVRCKG